MPRISAPDKNYNVDADVAAHIDACTAKGAATKRQITRWLAEGMIRRLRSAAPLSERQRARIIHFIAELAGLRVDYIVRREPEWLDMIQVHLGAVHEDEAIAEAFGPGDWEERAAADSPPASEELNVDRFEATSLTQTGPPPTPEMPRRPLLEAGAPGAAEAGYQRNHPEFTPRVNPPQAETLRRRKSACSRRRSQLLARLADEFLTESARLAETDLGEAAAYWTAAAYPTPRPRRRRRQRRRSSQRGPP